MALTRFPERPNRHDLLALVLTLGLLALFLEASRESAGPFHPSPISLDPLKLPEYTLRTAFRMGVALGLEARGIPKGERLKRAREAIARLGGRADLPLLAEEEGLEVDDLFPLLEALELSGFARVEKGDVELTPAGLAWVEASLEERKVMFAEHLLRRIPLLLVYTGPFWSVEGFLKDGCSTD